MEDLQEIGKVSGTLLMEGDGLDIYMDDLKAYIHEAEEGGYWAEVPALPGCLTQGETLDEIIENIDDAIQGWISVQTTEALIARGAKRIAETTDAVVKTPSRRSSRRGSHVRTFEFAA